MALEFDNIKQHPPPVDFGNLIIYQNNVLNLLVFSRARPMKIGLILTN